MHEQRTKRHGRSSEHRRRRPMRGDRGPRHGRHRARRGDVRSAILALLGEKPMHGYEMIQELEERSGGRWRPSAGSIYPTLQLMEDEGLVRAEEVDGKRVFDLTEAGRERLAEKAGADAPWEQGADRSLYHQFGQELRSLNAAAAQVARAGDESQLKQMVEALTETRKRLYRLLAD
jgi:DNA-binding PadR family transcriptional regulator